MDTLDDPTLELSSCPQCGAPAEVLDRFVLESTDGPVEHVTVSCIDRHRFTMLTEHLLRHRPVWPANTEAAERPLAPRLSA